MKFLVLEHSAIKSKGKIDDKGSMSKDSSERKDKRKHERYRAKLPVQLKIWLASHDSRTVLQGVQHILALAETQNISIGGMSLHIVGGTMDAGKSLSRANAMKVIGKPIEIVIENEDLTLWGDVIRTDMDSQELGMVIYKVSDVKLWKELCLKHIEGISIFPESPQLNRKRRS
jgi:hypothetical protein